MDLKDFQNVNHDDSSGDNITTDISTNNNTQKVNGGKNKNSKKTEQFVDSEFHNESDKIIKELEARIAAINGEDKKKQTTAKDDQEESLVVPEDDVVTETTKDFNETENVANDDVEQVIVQEGADETFIDKIKPFILPICLTLFALLFAAIFMYFFSQSRVEKSAQAIVNSQTTPEVIIVKEEKPKVQEVVVVPEKVVPECDPETQILNEELNECEDLPPPEPEPEPEPIGFENGTTTIVKVRFSFDKFNYDNPPRGIYTTGEQIFAGEYEGYKINASNRPYTNDMFFGIDRYMVSLIGVCRYVVDEADILISNMREVEGQKQFTGSVEKVIGNSKPHIVCDK